MTKNIFRPNKIDKYELVDKEAYEIIFREGKENFSELLRESESITNKSITMLIAVITIAGSTFGVCAKDYAANSCLVWCALVMTLLLFLVNLYFLYNLIKPKPRINSGGEPMKAIPDNLDSPDDKKHQVELVYNHNIGMLQRSIEMMTVFNEPRIKLYRIELILFLIFLGMSTFLFVALL